MMSKNKVPEICFNGFSKELVETRLGDICTIGDIDHRMPKSVLEGIPYLMTGDFIDNNSLDFKNCKFISIEDYEQLSRKIKPEVNDILFARYASVGDVRYVETDIKFLISYSCAIIKCNKDIVGRFLFYYLQSNRIQYQIEININTGSQRNIGIDSLKKLTIFIPKIKEQERIGNYFQQLNKLIEQKEKKYQKLKQFKKAMLDKMFPKNRADTPEIRFKGFSGKWEAKKLGDIGKTYTGLSGKTKEDFGHGEGKFVTYMNVFSNSISKKNLTEPIEIDEKQNEVQLGDVFFTTSSETPEEVGMTSVWMNEEKNIYLNSFCFAYRPVKVFDFYYLAYMLRSSDIRKKIVFLAQGISRYNISKNKVMEIYVPIPDIKEQEKIGNYFQKLDSQIDLQQKELEKLKNIKKTSLSKMFV
jgi:type I restriction enzyme, S subunit